MNALLGCILVCIIVCKKDLKVIDIFGRVLNAIFADRDIRDGAV